MCTFLRLTVELLIEQFDLSLCDPDRTKTFGIGQYSSKKKKLFQVFCATFLVVVSSPFTSTRHSAWFCLFFIPLKWHFNVGGLVVA